MTEPLLPYGRQWVDDDDVEAVARVLRGDWLTTGPAVEAFETALRGRSGAKHAVAVSSGTAALHTAYHAMGLGGGDEIVTSPLTFVATAAAAMHLGATVRFADVDPRTGNLDPEAAAAAIGPATRLLVPVDYAGHPADYRALGKVAAARGVRVVSDAAHSFGASAGGRPVGTLADVTATSFHPVKPVTTAEGGAVLTDLDDVADRASRFRSHGIVRDPEKLRGSGGAWYHEVQTLGLNYRLPDVLCALGVSQLLKLERFLARRRDIAARYTAAFAGTAGIETPTVLAGVEPGWHLYVLRVTKSSRREPLFTFLRGQGIGVQLHYIPVYHHPAFRDLGYEPGLCPRAEDLSSRAISLPIFPAMRDGDADRVIDAVLRGARTLL
jgi:UDP-4-amino-4,6-dideoxy-N-acetyl-beta-L-altrosamine transaminase